MKCKLVSASPELTKTIAPVPVETFISWMTKVFQVNTHRKSDPDALFHAYVYRYESKPMLEVMSYLWLDVRMTL